MSDNIPTPLASGATDHGGPNGIPPSSQSPASDAAMIAQDVANKYPNQAPAVLTSGTPQMPTLAPQGPAANAPNATSTPTSTPPTPQTPHEVHQSLYQRALSILAPPTRYLDAQGNPQQTRPSLSNSILSGAIAGLLTPTAYRQGAYGPVVDSQATAANAFAAGKQQRQEQDAAVQKHVEDVRSRKLQAIKDNADTIHLHVGVMQDAANMRGVIQTMNDTDAPLLKMAEENDKNLDSNDPNAKKAIWGRGFTMEQALRHPEWAQALTQHTLVHDGMLDVPDANGNLIPTPTYTIIDPNIKANMTKEAADIASQIYPSWKSAFEGSNGSMQARLGQLSAINNQVNSVKFAEKIFQDAADSDDKDLQSLGIKKDVKDTLMHAVRQGTPGAQQALQALMALENAKAANGTPADVLNRLINDPDTAAGRGPILNALGITAEKAQDYINKYNDQRLSAQALAKVGGMGEKAPASQDQISKLVPTLGPSTDLTPDDSKALMADVPAPDKDGVIHMTQGQIEKLTARRDSVVTANKNVAERQALDQGDPTVMAKIANNVIEGDVNDVAKLASYRGNARINAINAIHDEAARRGLDTTQYDEASLLNKTKTIDDFGGNKKGSTGSQIASFNAFLGHTAGAVDAEKRLEGKTFGLTRQPVINTAMDTIGKNLTNDPDWTAYKTSLLPVQNEISNFLAAGYATKEEDSRLMKTAIDPHETPARITAALRQLAETADVRLAEMGRRYLDTIGTTYPHLLSTDSANTLKRLNIASKSIPLSTTLPRGWQNGQATQMTDKNMARAYFQAANSDRAAAVALAKNNGWILQ